MKRFTIITVAMLASLVVSSIGESRGRHNSGGTLKGEEHYSDGTLKSRGKMGADGRKEGAWQYWYNNGSLMSEGSYKEGRPVGKWEYRNREGKIIAIKDFKEGIDTSESQLSEKEHGIAEPGICFESRGGIEDGEVTGYTILETEEIEAPFYEGKVPNVRCSSRTGGVLWWSDPFYNTVEMGDMPIEADYSHEEAVVRPREVHLTENVGLFPCKDMCHGDPEVVKIPKDNTPRELTEMHTEKAGKPTDLKHGRGAIWCLDCHSRTNRNKLYDHLGREISFNQPQKLCGKCHGQIYRDWRDGIHGKRIGMWTPGGKKRWWVCTECHDPHNVQQAPGNRGFAQLQPEPAPELPKGMLNTDHEKEHGHGSSHETATGGGSAGH